MRKMTKIQLFIGILMSNWQFSKNGTFLLIFKRNQFDNMKMWIQIFWGFKKIKFYCVVVQEANATLSNFTWFSLSILYSSFVSSFYVMLWYCVMWKNNQMSLKIWLLNSWKKIIHFRRFSSVFDKKMNCQKFVVFILKVVGIDFMK